MTVTSDEKDVYMIYAKGPGMRRFYPIGTGGQIVRKKIFALMFGIGPNEKEEFEEHLSTLHTDNPGWVFEARKQR